VENYLGFPDSVGGDDLLKRGRKQAAKYNAEFVSDEVIGAEKDGKIFIARGKTGTYRSRRILLATGLFHLPPEIPCVYECLGLSMFFCKDCDGWRVQGKRIAIVGNNNDATEYALGLLLYSPCVVIATNGKAPAWDEQHATWLKEYEISFFTDRIAEVDHAEGKLKSLHFESGPSVLVDALFATRGDIFHNKIAKALGAELDENGQVVVDNCMRTNVPGLYAAGCLTPANCQMIIAAGDGATAAQSINRDIFEEQLGNHELLRFREFQLENTETEPLMKSSTDH
jgi:thioredoxin reductase (NADPH)